MGIQKIGIAAFSKVAHILGPENFENVIKFAKNVKVIKGAGSGKAALQLKLTPAQYEKLATTFIETAPTKSITVSSFKEALAAGKKLAPEAYADGSVNVLELFINKLKGIKGVVRMDAKTVNAAGETITKVKLSSAINESGGRMVTDAESTIGNIKFNTDVFFGRGAKNPKRVLLKGLDYKAADGVGKLTLAPVSTPGLKAKGVFQANEKYLDDMIKESSGGYFETFGEQIQTLKEYLG